MLPQGAIGGRGRPTACGRHALGYVILRARPVRQPPTAPALFWPDDETFTAGSDGLFEVTGLKPGVRCSIGVHIKARPNTRIDTGQVFRNIVPERLGEIRDVGEVKVKVAAE